MTKRRQRTASHHGDCRASAGEPRLLRRRARHAAGEEERQPGRSGDLSPVLRRCGRTAGYRSHVFSVGADGAAAHRARTRRRGRPRSAGRQPVILGCSPRKIRRAHRTHRDSVRRARAAADRSSRVAARAGRADAIDAAVHAVGRKRRSPRRGRSAACTARVSGSAIEASTAQFLTTVLGFDALGS